ncbi:MAG: NADH-quinone oxidoreductase subunit N [Candidatus Sumerlaeota bacterium]|nr:NADH-quinone oxidoreductase subunit N [Candidatus Sumerlaeota bacterium]
MSCIDFQILAPLIILAVSSVAAMLLIALRRNHGAVAMLTAGALTLVVLSVAIVLPLAPRRVTSLLIMDDFGLFFIALIALGALAITAFSYGYFNRRAGYREEFYVLLLLATAGAATLAVSNHFISFFLALEILSVALYGMVAFTRERERSIEAGLKYLILAATSASFLLFGMALVYLRTGTMAFSAVSERLLAGVQSDLMLLAGLGMIIVGFGFKLAVAPFHLWTADVYEGSPAPATAFIATVSKGAIFALMLRFFARSSAGLPPALFMVFAAIAVASMFAGNLLALLQTNVKRMLAYSSIAHLGYLLVAFLAGGSLAMTAATYYLVAYFITTLGAFGIVSLLSEAGRDADSLDDYRALAWRRPWLAGVFIVMLFSLAGIPVTAGFVGKFYVLAAGVKSSLWILVLILAINSAIGLYYYLRVIVTMIARPQAAPERATAAEAATGGFAGAAALAALLLLLVYLGVYPAPLMAVLQSMAVRLP